MQDGFRCNYPEAACITRRLSNFFHMNFRYEHADPLYLHIAMLVNASIPSEKQYTVERMAMEILEAQKDLYPGRFSEEFQQIISRSNVTAATLAELSTWQRLQRVATRRRILNALRVQSLEQLLS